MTTAESEVQYHRCENRNEFVVKKKRGGGKLYVYFTLGF